MIPLLFALADTVMVPLENADLVLVQEWGLIEISPSACLAVGAPEGPSLPLPIDPSFCVEAPVVWFQGAEFSGTFTVQTPGGHLTVTYPVPDAVETDDSGMPHTASWHLSASALPRVDEIVEQMEESRWVPAPQDMGGFGWAAGIWREVETHFLQGTETIWMERFLYYECEVEDLLGEPEGNDSDWPFSGLQVPALVFRTGPEGQPETAACSIDGALPEGEPEYHPYDPDMLHASLCLWASQRIPSDKLTALVDTWEERLTTVPAGELLVLFPIPEAYYGRISTLDLRTDQDLTVVYKRLFLGMVAV
jgi:hypothetical protein